MNSGWILKRSHISAYAIISKRLKSTEKAITHHHCLIKLMQRGFNKGNVGDAGILQKQGQSLQPVALSYL